MKIISVEMENWRGYRFARIPFGSGVTAIIGLNGSGKTSILDAVRFVLFADHAGKLSGLLREGTKLGRVAVSLTSSFDGTDYLVEREFTAKTTTSYRVHSYHGTHEVVAEGSANVQRWLKTHMGVPPDVDLGALFTTTIGVPQGTFTAAFSLPTAPRRDVFNRALRVGDWEKAAKALRGSVGQLKDDKATLDMEIARIEGVLTVLPGLREEDKELAETIARLACSIREITIDLLESTVNRATLDKAAKLVEEARQKAERAQVALTQVATLAERTEALQASERQANQEVAQAQVKLEETKAGMEKATYVEMDIQGLQEEIDRLRASLAEANEAKATLRAEWRGLKKQSDFLTDAEAGACPTCGSELTADHRCDILSRNDVEMERLTTEAQAIITKVQIQAETAQGLVLKRVAMQAKLREFPSQGDLARARQDLDQRIQAWHTINSRLQMLGAEPLVSVIELKQQIAEYEQTKAGYDAEEHTKVQTETTRLQQELAGAGAQLKEKRYRLTVVNDSIERLERTQRQLDAKVGKVTETSDTLATIETVRDILREAGPYVTRRLVRQISQGAATLFADLMGDSGARLRWTDDYEIVVEERGHTRAFPQLSGGERMVAALAVRLSMLRQTSAIDVAFFDEPTAHLDPERRASLADAISRIKGFSQLFVISHDEAFQAAAENTVLIVMEGTGSRNVAERGSHASTE